LSYVPGGHAFPLGRMPGKARKSAHINGPR
jgi:hypothetical protein